MKKTIVVVDDFANTRWVIEFSLKNLNLEILNAENGQDALKYFDGRKVDLLITDYNMPEMNGIQLVQEIRQMSDYMHIPILMLTTERNPKVRQRADDVKVTAWIQKPFQQEHFLRVVKKSLAL